HHGRHRDDGGAAAPRRRDPRDAPVDRHRLPVRTHSTLAHASRHRMITLTALTKQYPGAPTPAVDHISLTVPEGEVCVLIGPSGCGKTTTMRLINKMIEPTSGKIELMGRDVTHMDSVELRRGIGYVIQQIGLFPHLTIAENIATVPRLLGWSEDKIGRRVDELLGLIA